MSTSQKHPKGLYTLFATEMWERFSYYGMRSLLTLYLTAKLVDDGFGLERAQALQVYAIFTGLVYLTPILGGWMADRFLGKRKTVYIGGLVMAIGQFLLASSSLLAHSMAPDTRLFLFNFGLGVLILGNGFFKPNISTIVGDFYDDNDPRKDAAFNIFYFGINLGAILGTFIAGGLGENVNWGYGFLTAGIGMILSVIWMYLRERTLLQFGLPPNSPADKFRLDAKDWVGIVVYAVGCVAATFVAITAWNVLPTAVHHYVTVFGLLGILIAIGYVIAKGTNGGDEWSRMLVIIVLAIFNVVFWAGFEQAGGTFTLFAEQNTDRIIPLFNNWEMPASWFQNVNSLAILVFAPIFSIVWVKLDKMKLNPRTTIKFALGLFLGALAFVLMIQADHATHGGTTAVSPLWLVGVYTLLTFGELMLSPIGLSMITKLAPEKLVSVVMGLWMASFAAGNYMAGMLESILQKYDFSLYPFIAVTMLISGLCIVALSPLLNKAMKGIH